jgi:hypothetical protein
MTTNIPTLNLDEDDENRDWIRILRKQREGHEFKSLDEAIEAVAAFAAALETKGHIHHVRTPAGVRKYDQPIGSVIVRDPPRARIARLLRGQLGGDESDPMARRLRKPTGTLKKVSSEDGWDGYEDGPERRFVGKVGKDWVVTRNDETDHDVPFITASSKAEAIRLMNEAHDDEFGKKPTAVAPTPRRLEKPPAARPPVTTKPAAGAGRPTGLLRKTGTENGWDTYQDGGYTFRVGKDPKRGHVALDDKNKVIVSGETSKTATVAALRDQYNQMVPDKELVQFPRKAPKGTIYDRTPTAEIIKRDRLHPAQTEREIIAHREAYGYQRIPDTALQVYLSDDPEDPNVQNAAYYMQPDAAGRPYKWQPRQMKHVAQANAEDKFARVREMAPDVIEKLDPMLTQARVNKDDTWAAIAMMRKLGMRVGTPDGVDENIGCTQLLVKHVSFPADNVAEINFTAKKGTAVSYETDDPLIVNMLKVRMKRGTNARLFDTTDKRTMEVQRATTGKNYQNHDFRRLFATTQAAALVKALPKKRWPKTPAEFDAIVKNIGDSVNEMLQEKSKGVALTSYIDPEVFAAMRRAVERK